MRSESGAASRAPFCAAWMLGGLAFAAGLLGAVLLVASVAQPEDTYLYIPGVNFDADVGDSSPSSGGTASSWHSTPWRA